MFFLVISCFEEGVTIFINHFLNSNLLMTFIVRSCRIISPSMECKRDNVMYMLCTLVEQCQVVGKGLLSSGQMFEYLSLNINQILFFKPFSKTGFSTNANLVIFMLIFWVAC